MARKSRNKVHPPCKFCGHAAAQHGMQSDIPIHEAAIRQTHCIVFLCACNGYKPGRERQQEEQ